MESRLHFQLRLANSHYKPSVIYDTCSMWLGHPGVEFLQSNHRLKTALLTFPMLGVYCVALYKKKRNA